MARTFAEAEEVWLPSVIGSHPGHLLARDAALRAAERSGRREVVLHAGFPYVLEYGRPASAVGREVDPYFNVDGWLNRELVKSGLDPAAPTLTATKLDIERRCASPR
jgi:hypothetical protein